MNTFTGDFTGLKGIIFEKACIKDIDDLKSHENYANFDYVHFFECIDDVISAAEDEDKPYFSKLKEAMEHCRDYSEATANLEKLMDEKRILSDQLDECSDIKSDNMVSSVRYIKVAPHRHIIKETDDSPKGYMIFHSLFSIILAVLVFLGVIMGPVDITLMFVLWGFILIYWFIGFFKAAASIGPYEDACAREIELAPKIGELATKINETDEKATFSKREAYMCYRELNKMGK